MDQQLRAQILAVLQTLAASSPVLASPTATEKLYEVFVWSCAIRSLQRIGATLECRDSYDRPTNTIVFRLAPGLIFSPASAPGFVKIDYNGQEYELHGGVRIEGRSGVLHELDVAVFKRDEAVRCRQNSISPSYSKTKMLFECKFYGNSLPLHLGREFIGLCAECSMRIKAIASNQERDEIRRLIRPHRATAHFTISPLTPNRVDDLIGWLATEFKQVL